jgi:hypothetical protein
VIPLVLVDLITDNYPQLATAFMSDIKMYVMFFGGMIVASSTLEAAHRPGTYTRMVFGLSAIAFVCLWFFVVFGGGIAEITYGPYFVRFDMSKIVYIIIFGLSLKSLLVVSTFGDFKGAERERARKKRLEQAEQKARGSRPLPTPRPRPSSFASFKRTEFEVTADDDVDHATEMPSRPVAKGMKVCEVCGAEAPVKDYVCRNCGEWFHSDSHE